MKDITGNCLAQREKHWEQCKHSMPKGKVRTYRTVQYNDDRVIDERLMTCHPISLKKIHGGAII